MKGSQVYVEGRIQSRDWTDRDGQKRKTTEVIVGYLTMLGSKRQDGDANYSISEPAYSGEKIPF